MVKLLITLAITIGILVLIAKGLRALRRRFKAVDNIFYILLLVVFVLTWVASNFWWALLSGVIFILFGVIFLGIGSNTELQRHNGTYTFPECECGYEKWDIIEDNGDRITIKCKRCGRELRVKLNGAGVYYPESQPQRELDYGRNESRRNDTDPYDEEMKRREQEKQENKERERQERRREYEDLMYQYESIMSDARDRRRQADTYLSEAQSHLRKYEEYGDEDHLRWANDNKDKAEIYINDAERFEKEARYYYDRAQQFKD